MKLHQVSFPIRLDARGQRRCLYERFRISEQIERRTPNVQLRTSDPEFWPAAGLTPDTRHPKPETYLNNLSVGQYRPIPFQGNLPQRTGRFGYLGKPNRLKQLQIGLMVAAGIRMFQIDADASGQFCGETAFG